MSMGNKGTDEFVGLLRQSLMSDNIQRKESEQRLQSIDRETKIGLLLNVLMTQKDVEILEIGALMLRQQVEVHKTVSQFSADCMAAIKNTVPQLCLQQQNTSVRNKLVDVISSVYNLTSFELNLSWPELSTFFYDCLVRSNVDAGRLIGFRLLRSSPGVVKSLSDENLRDVFRIIVECMSTLPGNSNNISISNDLKKDSNKIALESIKAFTSIAIDMNYKRIKPYINSTVQVIFHLIKSCNDPDISAEILQEINALVECRSRIMKEHIITILQIAISILASAHAPEKLRTPCMEVIVGLAENLKKPFKDVAKEHLPSIVDILLRHMTLIDEDPSWAFTVSEDDEENEIATEAETSLDRLTCALGGKTMFPIIMEQISPLLASKVWQHRSAALTTISCIAEGCKRVLKPFLPSVVDAISPFMRDEHPRVIYTCINAVGQLTVDYESYFQLTFHATIFPLVIFAAENYTNLPRLHAHAICCFVNLIDSCPLDVLKIYSDSFFKILHDSLINSVNNLDKPAVSLVMENSLSSLGKLANALGIEFSKYYSSIVPELMAMVRTFSNTPHVQYYIDTLDSLADILMAVGSENCMQDLDQILDLLKRFEIQVIKNDGDRNYQIEYLEIMADIAKLFKENFSPVLPKLMPTLLEISNISLEKHLIQSVVSEGNDTLSNVYSAHTDALNDKYSVLRIVYRLVKMLKGHMVAYYDQICDCAVNNFTSTYDADIHNICCDIFVHMLKNANQSAPTYMIQLWNKIFSCIYTRVLNHDMVFDPQPSYDCLRRCVKTVSYNGLNNDILFKINELMDYEISLTIRNIGSVVQVENKDETADDLDEDFLDESTDENDQEERSLSAVHDLQRCLLKILNKNCLPFYVQINPRIIQLSECENTNCRSWALCMFTNVFEFVPEESVHFSGMMLERIKISLNDRNPHILQAAAYNVGIIAEFAGQYYQPFLSEALAQLVRIVTSINKDDESMAVVSSNAICACAKIMKFVPGLISSFDAAVKTWVSWLPTHEDEVDFILGYLLELIETKFQVVAGPNNSNLFQALDSIASMLPLANDFVTKKTVEILQQIKTHVPDAFNVWFSNLSPSLKENIVTAHSISGFSQSIT